jgi:hypothetical protein
MDSHGVAKLENQNVSFEMGDEQYTLTLKKKFHQEIFSIGV